MTNQTLAELEQQVLARPWFYEFKLPSGKTTPTYGEGRFNAIHDTRQRMIDDALTHRMNGEVDGKTVIDLACNQGYFSAQMAARGAASIHGIDARQEHIDDALLIHRAMGYDNFSAEVCDIEDVSKERFGQFDIVLLLCAVWPVLVWLLGLLLDLLSRDVDLLAREAVDRHEHGCARCS